jgi:hypothetical protein
LQSLTPDYQYGVVPQTYEVHLLERDARPCPPLPGVSPAGPDYRWHHPLSSDAPLSCAINAVATQTQGRCLGLMLGAPCLLTPGLLHAASTVFKMFANPLILTRHFYLKPSWRDVQSDAYKERGENFLLEKINWPEAGYRLYEVGSPYPSEDDPASWFTHVFESSCIFLRRDTFLRLGGCDERMPGSGGLGIGCTLFRRAALAEDSQIVQLIGEAVFYEGLSQQPPATLRQQRAASLDEFMAEYETAYGEAFSVPDRKRHYFGHMPSAIASLKMNGKQERSAA